MLSMKPSGGFIANFVSNTFQAMQVGTLQFAVAGLTAGSISFEYSNDNTNWHKLDGTSLDFSADGTKVATWGNCLIRCVGDASVAGSSLDVLIDGTHIIPG